MERLLDLLTLHEISAVADVRSTPSSKFAPQFNRPSLNRMLQAAGIGYVFLGEELGARSSDPRMYVDGKVQYRRLADTPEFNVGINRLEVGASRGRVAILCSEQDPLDCHRTILISRVLVERGKRVMHILKDGRTETHFEAIARLRERHKLNQPSLLDTEEELVARALELQEAEIAYVDENLGMRA